MPPTKDKSLDELLDTSKPILRKHQREEWQREIDQTNKFLAREKQNPNSPVQASGRIFVQNESRKKLLASQSPRPLSGEEKDRVAALERQMLSEIQEGMPTQVEQRRNVPGVQYKIRQWHNANKGKVLKWKRCRILLNPDSDDRELTNVERYRPVGAMGALTTDAAIPGLFSLSPQAKEHYDEINWQDGGQNKQELEAAGVAVRSVSRPTRLTDTSHLEVHETPDAVIVTPDPVIKRGRGRPRKTA